MVRARATPNPANNRTDRNVPNVQAPSQQYGERQQQQAAQRAVPIAQPPGIPQSAAPSTPAPTGTPSTPQGQPSGPAGPVGQGLPPVSGPGILPFLHPSNRPNEPVTAGLPTGAGPGPESLTGVGAIAANQAVEQGTLRNLLSSLASGPTSSAAVRDLAAVAGGGQS
jgi:hypothetical protein